MLFSRKNPPIGFYVYLYLRIDGTPYYVGKGKNKRAWAKHKVNIPKDDQRIQFIAIKLLEHEAFTLEIHLIQMYGRKDNDTGILRNMTNGGEGLSGFKPSDESKEKNRISNSGVNHSYYGITGEAHFNYGRKHPEHSERMKGSNNSIHKPGAIEKLKKNTPRGDQHHTKTQLYRDSVRGENNPMFGKKRLDLAKRNSRRCISPTGKIFNSLKEAGESCDKSIGSIYGLIIRGVSGWGYEK